MKRKSLCYDYYPQRFPYHVQSLNIVSNLVNNPDLFSSLRYIYHWKLSSVSLKKNESINLSRDRVLECVYSLWMQFIFLKKLLLVDILSSFDIFFKNLEFLNMSGDTLELTWNKVSKHDRCGFLTNNLWLQDCLGSVPRSFYLLKCLLILVFWYIEGQYIQGTFPWFSQWILFFAHSYTDILVLVNLIMVVNWTYLHFAVLL